MAIMARFIVHTVAAVVVGALSVAARPPHHKEGELILLVACVEREKADTSANSTIRAQPWSSRTRRVLSQRGSFTGHHRR